jgi:hypothetical protein
MLRTHKMKYQITSNINNNWANELNRYFSNEGQMYNKYMKKCSTSLAIKTMKTKPT